MAAEYNGEALRQRVRTGPPLLLDGATGTELERRGLHTGLPLWSTHALLDAPDAVAEIHRAYRGAGAELITANTFRTQRRTLAAADARVRPADLAAWASELTRQAVELARAAGPGAVAGSAPPLKDCYRPDLVPDAAALDREHAEHARNLARAGVDLILVETHNCIREARVAARAARETGLPFWVSFVSWRDASLLSGEPLVAAIDAVAEHGPDAVLVNCLPPSAVGDCLTTLQRCGLPFGVYANLGEPEDEKGFQRSESCSPEEFARHASVWVTAGARIVGGCCGTGPEHVRAIAERLHDMRNID